MKYKCPYCGSNVRINTKYYNCPAKKTKQAGCSNKRCGAKGPLSKTNEKARAIFGVKEQMELFDETT